MAVGEAAIRYCGVPPLLWGQPGRSSALGRPCGCRGHWVRVIPRTLTVRATQPLVDRSRRSLSTLGLDFSIAFALTTLRAVDNVYPPVPSPPLQQVLAAKQRRTAWAVVGRICTQEVAHRWVATFRIPTSGLVGIVGVCPVLCGGKLSRAGPAPDHVTARSMVKPLHTYNLWVNSGPAIVRVPRPLTLRQTALPRAIPPRRLAL